MENISAHAQRLVQILSTIFSLTQSRINEAAEEIVATWLGYWQESLKALAAGVRTPTEIYEFVSTTEAVRRIADDDSVFDTFNEIGPDVCRTFNDELLREAAQEFDLDNFLHLLEKADEAFLDGADPDIDFLVDFLEELDRAQLFASYISRRGIDTDLDHRVGKALSAFAEKIEVFFPADTYLVGSLAAIADAKVPEELEASAYLYINLGEALVKASGTEGTA